MINKDTFYVVGVGLSAGGLEPLREMLSCLPPAPGAAFVIVSHLQATAQSKLDTILAGWTSMPVTWMEHGRHLQPDHVYLLPPGKMATLDSGGFSLRERRPEEKINRSVTIFFSSLAGQAGNRAIGVILSGNGEDGLEGVKEIENKGGIVMVQHPATARFTGMPATIVNQNHPDVITTPHQLARALMSHLKVPPYSFGTRNG
jgi:two-component system CheB/CheR fusion protein